MRRLTRANVRREEPRETMQLLGELSSVVHAWVLQLAASGARAALLWALILGSAHAATPQEAVKFGSHTLFYVTEGIGLSASARANLINQRLARWPAGSSASVHVEMRESGPTILIGDEALLDVTLTDAVTHHTTPEELAVTWAQGVETELHAQLPASNRPGAEDGAAVAWQILALLGILLGGTIASWLINWAAGRIAESPRRYGLPLPSAAVTVGGGLLSLLIALGTVASALTYWPGGLSPSLLAVFLTLGAILLTASAEILGNLAGGVVIAFTPLFQVGDLVRMGGHVGRVNRIGLLFTYLQTERHGPRLIPHGAVLRRGVSLLSEGDKELRLTVHLAYTVSQALARAIILEAAFRTEGLQGEPECLVGKLKEESIGYELCATLESGQRAELVSSHFHLNLLDVLAENDRSPQGFHLLHGLSTGGVKST